MTTLYVLNGPAKGRSFKLRQGASFVGRSPDNDIRIEDKTLSRKHLRILKKSHRLFLTDLKSRNGTFYGSDFLKPGISIEIEEGSPIAVGMTVICIGEGCEQDLLPFPDPAGLVDAGGDGRKAAAERRERSDEKRTRLLSNLSDFLKANAGVEETLENIIGQVFHYLKRVDRAAFVLVDPESGKITKDISKSKRKNSDPPYCTAVVIQVVETGMPYVVSNVQTEDETGLVNTLKVLKIESVMCVPLICRSKILGVIYVDSIERPYGFRRDDYLLFMDLSQRIAVALEHARVASDLMAIADSLSSDVDQE
jgi:GAF domain-containing protein